MGWRGCQEKKGGGEYEGRGLWYRGTARILGAEQGVAGAGDVEWEGVEEERKILEAYVGRKGFPGLAYFSFIARK